MTTGTEKERCLGDEPMSDDEDESSLPIKAPVTVSTVADAGGDAANGCRLSLPPIDGLEIKAAHVGKKGKDAEYDAIIAKALSSLGRVALNQYDRCVVIGEFGGRYGALPLASSKVDDIIQAKVAAAGLTINKDRRNAEKEKLRGNAILDGKKVRTYIRVAKVDDIYYHDLGDGQMVVTKPGNWSVEKNSTIPFSMVGGVLPTPVKPDSVTAGYEFICQFLERAGVPSHMHLIAVVVLLEWLRPDTAYPLLDVVGPSGSGKTTTLLMLINLIDPASEWKIPETALEEDDIAAAALNRLILFIDNSGTLKNEVQNLACRVCYGTVLMAREYYTQGEVFQAEVHCPITLSSINPAVTNPDLLARTVRVAFKPRSGGYVSEVEVRRQYQEDRARLLGALHELLAQSLAILPAVVSQRVWPHRMVDFAQLGEAVAQSVGTPAGTFVEALGAMREGVANDIIEGDGFVTAIVGFLKHAAETAKDADAMDSYKTWAESPGYAAFRRGEVIRVAVKSAALRDYMEKNAPVEFTGHGCIRPKWLPENPRALTSILNVKLPLLVDLGVKARNSPDYGGKKNGAWEFIFREVGDA